MTGQRVIRTNQSIVPFFGQRMTFIRGLDPLGLQNTSDATFTLLLPGLNNVTGRIRYYSFYCWLLDQYSKRNGSTDPETQRKFIRKAEYIIALCSQIYKTDNSSIPGSNYAKAEIQSDPSREHDLEAGIAKPDGTTANTYWNFRWGAFGQYYLGSLRAIDIIIERDNNARIYARTNSQEKSFVSGELLADAFDGNITDGSKNLFFDCIENGAIRESQLEKLLPDFNLTVVPAGTDEQSLIVDLLIQKDYPLRIEEEPLALRRQSLYHLLKYAESQPSAFDDRHFIYSAYDAKGIAHSEQDVSLFGWYFYQFNEFWHFANTSILNGLLGHLESTAGAQWVMLHEFVKDAAELIVNVLKEEATRSNSTSVSAFVDRMSKDEFLLFDQCKQSNSLERAANGFMLIFRLYLRNFNELVALREYGESNEVSKDGAGSEYFLREFTAKLELPLLDFIRDYLFRHIIYRHQYVAFRKIRGGGLSTQKIIIEDHRMRYLGNFEAAYTGPRVGNLIAFLKDLHIISEDNTLTEYGREFLKRISSRDD